MGKKSRQLLKPRMLAENQSITLDNLPDNLLESIPPAQDHGTDARTLAAVRRCHVQGILNQARGNVAKTARVLGISRRSLYRLIQKYRIAVNGGLVEIGEVARQL
jgi:transcriptional regulator of acetoin/glycerol metabolism